MILQPFSAEEIKVVTRFQDLVDQAEDGKAIVLHHEGNHGIYTTPQGLVRGNNLFGNSESPPLAKDIYGKRKLKPCASVALRNVVFFPNLSLFLTEEGKFYQDTFTYIPQWGNPSNVDKAFRRDGNVYEVDDKVLLGARKEQFVSQLTLSVSTIARNNFGHFLFDGLGAGVAQYTALAQNDPVIAWPLLKPWQREIITLAGLGRRSIEFGRPTFFEHVITNTHVAGHLQFPTRLARMAIDQMRFRCATDFNAPKRIYIRRDPGTKRDIRNREEIENILHDRGFTFFKPEAVSVEEQIRTVGQAEIIVGQGGAGMANVFFAPQSVEVLEIMPSAYPDSWLRASSFQMGNAWSLLCCHVEPDAVRRNVNPYWPGAFDFDYNVPVEEFVAALDMIIRRAAEKSN